MIVDCRDDKFWNESFKRGTIVGAMGSVLVMLKPREPIVIDRVVNSFGSDVRWKTVRSMLDKSSSKIRKEYKTKLIDGKLHIHHIFG